MHGFIVIDKPAALTSAAVVGRLKKLLPKKIKIGHTGTLDPNVTGVLPVALGKATKSIAFMGEERKVYRCTLRFGIRTDSADIWGTELEKKQVSPFTTNEINVALAALTGKLAQTPPMYSAAKHNGKRLYELARSGQVVERRAKSIEIFSYGDVVYNHPELSFTVYCSRGTYVRTLCEDIAGKLNSIATMTALRRLASGPFKESDSIALENLTRENIGTHLLPIDFMFGDCAVINVDFDHAKHLLNGVKVDLRRFTNAVNPSRAARYAVYYNTLFVGVAENRQSTIKFIKAFIDIATLEANQ